MQVTIVLFILYSITICTTSQTTSFSLMLDPAGDAQHTGRMLNDTFERSITLQCTELLKKNIEAAMPQVRVILTRFPGESIEPLQNANFANRLDVHLYISIHCYKECGTKPQMHVYYVSFNDEYLTKKQDLCFYPYTQAHHINSKKTKHVVTEFSNVLSEKKYHRLYDFKGCFGIPFKPLVGITSPAIALEISIKNSHDLHTYIQPIANSIIHVIKQYEA